jgi:hypothetical protein
MYYIDGQKNKYSVLNECSRMLKYNILFPPPCKDHGGPQVCEISRFPNFLGNQLIYGSEDVGLTAKANLHPRNIPGIHFC